MKTSSFCSAIKNLNSKRTAYSVCLSVRWWENFSCSCFRYFILEQEFWCCYCKHWSHLTHSCHLLLSIHRTWTQLCPISPKGSSRCSSPTQPFCKVRNVHELIYFLIHGKQKISNYLPAPFTSVKAQHISNSLHRSFQVSGFASPMYIQDDVPFLAGNLQSGYTTKDNLERGDVRTHL